MAYILCVPDVDLELRMNWATRANDMGLNSLGFVLSHESVSEQA